MTRLWQLWHTYYITQLMFFVIVFGQTLMGLQIRCNPTCRLRRNKILLPVNVLSSESWVIFINLLKWVFNASNTTTGLFIVPLQWRHNGRDGVSNHQPHDCFFNRSFRRRLKETSKLRVTGFCVEHSPGTVEFPAQMASSAENVSILWRHHVRWGLSEAAKPFVSIKWGYYITSRI